MDMYSIEEIENKVLNALQELINESKGTCVTFTPKRIAKLGGLSTKPVMLTLVREFLDELVKFGFLEHYKVNSKRKVYMVTSKSEL